MTKWRQSLAGITSSRSETSSPISTACLPVCSGVPGTRSPPRPAPDEAAKPCGAGVGAFDLRPGPCRGFVAQIRFEGGFRLCCTNRQGFTA